MPIKESIYDLLNRNAKIWVQNSTHPLGTVSLTLANGDPFPIPKTKNPICLSDVLSEKEIRESQQLRNALSKGLLKLVSSKQAETYYEVTKQSPEDVFKKQEDIVKQKVLDTPNLNEQEVSYSTETLNVAPAMVQLALSLSHPEITDAQAIDTVESKFAEFTPEDLGYLMSHVHRPAVSEYLLNRQRELQEPNPVEVFVPPTNEGDAPKPEAPSRKKAAKKTKKPVDPVEAVDGLL